MEEEDIVEVEVRYSEKEKYAVFDKEFMPHIDSMYNFAFRLTNDEDDAHDPHERHPKRGCQLMPKHGCSGF